MIKSMTAFAGADRTEGDFSVSVEVRSYNSRYLDTVLRVPASWQSIEERIKTLISEKVSRGRLEIKLQIQETSEEACAFEIDGPKAKAYYQTLLDLKTMFGLEDKPVLDNLTRVSGLIRPAEVERDTDACWPLISGCIIEALDCLDEMRTREGDFIARDFAARLDLIETTIDQIEASSGGLLEMYQEKLKERIAALTRNTVELDPARIAQEAAFLADRSDISEEIVRARSHVAQFRTIMASDEAGGRKLNFLLQEFNREFNTMGSKTGKAEVSHIIVGLKTELEKLREQVQNIE